MFDDAYLEKVKYCKNKSLGSKLGVIAKIQQINTVIFGKRYLYETS
jgi:hypothetical protein